MTDAGANRRRAYFLAVFVKQRQLAAGLIAPTGQIAALGDRRPRRALIDALGLGPACMAARVANQRPARHEARDGEQPDDALPVS